MAGDDWEKLRSNREKHLQATRKDDRHGVDNWTRL